MKQCATLSPSRQWPVNKLACRVQLPPPLILPHLLACLLSLSGGDVFSSQRPLRHSFYTCYFQAEESCSSFWFLPLFIFSLSLIPRRLCCVGWLVADILYSLLNTTDPTYIYLLGESEKAPLEGTSKQCLCSHRAVVSCLRRVLDKSECTTCV